MAKGMGAPRDRELSLGLSQSMYSIGFAPRDDCTVVKCAVCLDPLCVLDSSKRRREKPEWVTVGFGGEIFPFVSSGRSIDI